MSEIKTNKRFDRLTNLDISTHYKDRSYYLFKKDILSAFSYWLIKQSPYDTPDITNALKAYDEYLSKTIKWNEDFPSLFTYHTLENIVHEQVFESIPEIEIFNHAKKEIDGFMASSSRFHKTKPDYDYVDLGALARNVFYMILREQITQD